MLEKQVITKTPHMNPVNHGSRTSTNHSLFTRENYLWMLAGLVLITLGMILMGGGKSNDPTVFNPKEVYSTTRITIAPLLIIIGLGIEVFAIFKKPKQEN